MEDHNLIDSHYEVELWNSIEVEAASGHHALHAITHNSNTSPFLVTKLPSG